MKTTLKIFCLILAGICISSTSLGMTIDINMKPSQKMLEEDITKGARELSMACTTHEKTDDEGKVTGGKDIILMAYGNDNNYNGISVYSGTFLINQGGIDWKKNSTLLEGRIGCPSIAANANRDIVLFYEKYDSGTDTSSIWYKIGKTLVSSWGSSDLETKFDDQEYCLYKYDGSGEYIKGSKPSVAVTANATGGGYVYVTWIDSNNNILLRTGRLQFPMDDNGKSIEVSYDNNGDFIPAPFLNENNREPIQWSSTHHGVASTLSINSIAVSLNKFEEGSTKVISVNNNNSKDLFYRVITLKDALVTNTSYPQSLPTKGLNNSIQSFDIAFSENDYTLMVASGENRCTQYYIGTDFNGTHLNFFLPYSDSWNYFTSPWCYPYIALAISPKVNGDIVIANVYGNENEIYYSVGNW